MAVKMETTNRRSGLERRFTLLDGMIAVAALAVGLALIRYLDLGFEWEFHSTIWTHPRVFYHSWMFEQLVVQIFHLATITALSLTLAALAFRLRRPRPTRRRLASQPGMAAIQTAVVAWIISAPWVSLRFSGSPESTGYVVQVLGMNLGMVAVLAGFGVAARWGMLFLSRHWRSEPSWIDRLGRLIGIGWMALSLWAINLRMVC